MPEKKKVRNEQSAGGAVIRLNGSAAEVAMIATRRGARWGLPKGAASAGETLEQAAVREVEEETGLKAEILIPLDPIEYFFRAGDTLIQKRVSFFVMRYLEGQIRPQLSEVDDAQWFSLDEAIEKASFDSERSLLIRVRQMWQELRDEERVKFTSPA